MTRALPLAALLALAACQADDPAPTPAPGATASETAAPAAVASGPVAVSDAFTPAAPQGGTGGVFMTVVGGAEPDTLVGARFEGAQDVQVHETYDAGDGLRGMREVPAGVPVPAGATVRLAPGGYHVMLLGLSRPLAEGDSLDLVAEFARAGAVPVRVAVVGLDAMPRRAE